MALFRKSKEQHLQILENMSNPLEIQEYFQKEGINLTQLNEYLEGRNLLKGSKDALNYQDNRTYVTVVKETAKGIKEARETTPLPLAQEQVEQNRDTGILWNIVGVIVVSSLVLLTLYLVGTSIIDALTPSAETVKSIESGASTFGTVFLSVIGGIIALYLLALPLTGRGSKSKRKQQKEENQEEENEVTKKFREERARVA